MSKSAAKKAIVENMELLVESRIAQNDLQDAIHVVQSTLRSIIGNDAKLSKFADDTFDDMWNEYLSNRQVQSAANVVVKKRRRVPALVLGVAAGYVIHELELDRLAVGATKKAYRRTKLFFYGDDPKKAPAGV